MSGPTHSRPWFCTAERRQRLQDELRRWEGTRWAHAGANPAGMVPGVQGDCLWWVLALKNIGAVPPNIAVPCYRRREALADGMGRLLREIVASGRAVELDLPTERMPGDLLLFAQGMSGAHCGLVVDHESRFAHLGNGGFLVEPWTQRHWQEALRHVFRLVETEENR